MSGFLSVVKKEFIHFRRDTTTLIIAIVIPLIQLCIYGYAIDFDVRHIRSVVVDYDRTPESHDYINRLQATGYIDFVARKNTTDDATQAIRTGYAKVAVIIPPGFSRSMITPKGASVGVLIDGSDGQAAFRARAALAPAPVTAVFNTIEPRMDVIYNPDMRTQIFTIPGLIGIIMLLVTVSLTSSSIVQEREQGTLEQLMVTPISKVALIFGKLFPFACLAFLEMILIMSVGYVLFDVSVAGSLILLMLLSIPYIVGSLAMGLLISTVAQNQSQSLQLSLLMVLPAVLLSGFVFPRETMPGSLFLISTLLPITHYIELARGIYVKNAGFIDVLPSFLAMCTLMGFLIFVALRKFKKSID